MDESIYDIFTEITSFFSSMIRGFYRLIFFEDRSYYMTFIFITVPILFAALEAIFDFIIPTFTDLRPMGIRRFFIPRAEALKCPEIKLYTPVKSDKSNILKYNKFGSEKFNISPSDQKRYQTLYQKKYNTTANPVELKRFIYLQRKTDISHRGFVKEANGLKASANGMVNFGKHIKFKLKSQGRHFVYYKND